ncbi:MAG TPA: hypothetical protein VGL18_15965 [Actinomycetota bacterium]|jgi:hypothetical protein
MKRLLVALLIGGAVFAGVFGVAASLGVTSDSLGAGNSVVAACQAGTVSVSYTPSYSASAPAGYRATTVTVGNIDTSPSACGGKAIQVTLTGPGGSNASLGEQTGTTPTSGSSMSFTFASVSASDVTGVHVVIAG